LAPDTVLYEAVFPLLNFELVVFVLEVLLVVEEDVGFVEVVDFDL